MKRGVSPYCYMLIRCAMRCHNGIVIRTIKRLANRPKRRYSIKEQQSSDLPGTDEDSLERLNWHVLLRGGGGNQSSVAYGLFSSWDKLTIIQITLQLMKAYTNLPLAIFAMHSASSVSSITSATSSPDVLSLTAIAWCGTCWAWFDF